MLKHRTSSKVRTLLEISFDWLQIIFLLASLLWVHTWWSFLAVFILVGTKQYSLLVLLHDAQHSLLSTSRRENDLIAIWLISAPFGVTFTKSRMVHMQHHQNLGLADSDPDYPLYCINEPEPKNTPLSFVLHFARQILWAKVMRVFRPNLTTTKNNGIKLPISAKNNAEEIFAVLTCQAIIFSLFAITGYWYAYFILWIAPLLTVATLLNDVRIFCEHSNPQFTATKEKGILISYFSSPIERFFFGPHHMNYHAEHHFFPFVPHYNLPKVREVLKSIPEYQQQIQWRKSYCSHLSNFIKSVQKITPSELPSNHSSEII